MTIAGRLEYPRESPGSLTQTSSFSSQHYFLRMRVMHERASCFMQDLQRSSWQPSSPSSPSKAPQSVAAVAEEGRVARNISARVESAVLPSLGSVAARCNHLISQASVAFGARHAPAAHYSTDAHHCCDVNARTANRCWWLQSDL